MKRSVFVCLFLVFSVVLSAQVSKTVTCTAGALNSLLTVTEKNTITDLTITGVIDARDFKTMRDSMDVLSVINLTSTTISYYYGNKGTRGTWDTDYPANEVPESAFTNNGAWYKTSLTSINLPTTTNTIASRAFDGCKGLTSIVIPPSVVKIESWALSNCSSLTSLSLPSSVTTIHDDAFHSSSGNVTVDATNTVYSSHDGLLFKGSVLMHCPISKTGSYAIPSWVTKINDRTFEGCSKLTSISNLSSITEIGYCVFYDCSGLISVNIPSTVEIIGSMAFSGCKSLKSITIPGSVTTIKDYALSYCDSLISISIPSSVVTLGSDVFKNCYGLQSVEILAPLKTIDYSTFDGCTSLISVNIPSTVTSIRSSAFVDCSNLPSIVIPSLVDTIQSSAFGSCKKLTSITIPATIKFIGSQAFGYCEGLKSIYANSITPLPLNSTSQVFWAVDKTNCTLYVPTGSVNAYRTANQWGDFVTIIDASGFVLSADTLLLAAPQGSSDKILITSNVDWNATSDQTWLSIDPNSGSGSKEITFTAELNQLAGSRKATVTFRSSEASQTVTVIQSPFALKNFKATATSSNQIDLSWQLDENADPVLIAYSKNNTFGKPVDGVSYLPGQVIPGGGIVLYSGSGTQYSHSSLRSNTTYYYRAFSLNPLFYYEGVSSNDTTLIDQSDLYSYTQDFSSGTLPAGWKIVDHQGNGEVWAFNNPGVREINTTTNGNGFVIIDSDNFGNGEVQDCDLISPVFDFTKAKGVLIQFEHFFRYYFGSTATLSYSTDGGSSWTLLQSWEESTDNATLFLQDLTPQLAGFSKVCFKWNYVGNYAYYWALDDIKISADISSIPETIAITDTIFSIGADNCSGAMQVITIAGIGTTVEFQSGSTVNLIAGSTIRFLPGFHAFEGSFAHAWITTDGTFCDGASGAIVENPLQEKSGDAGIDFAIGKVYGKELKVYPNPNNGKFTIEIIKAETEAKVEIKVEVKVYNALGERVYQAEMQDRHTVIDLSGIRRGLYVVMVTDGQERFMRKVMVE